MNTKIRPSFSITNFTKTTPKLISKASIISWTDFTNVKSNSSTKKSSVFLKNNKISPSPHKKAHKYSLTLKTKTKSPITATSSTILLKTTVSFSTKKLINRWFGKIYVTKLTRPFKTKLYPLSISKRNPFLINPNKNN
jgi:hypothetical protein